MFFKAGVPRSRKATLARPCTKSRTTRGHDNFAWGSVLMDTGGNDDTVRLKRFAIVQNVVDIDPDPQLQLPVIGRAGPQVRLNRECPKELHKEEAIGYPRLICKAGSR